MEIWYLVVGVIFSTLVPSIYPYSARTTSSREGRTAKYVPIATRHVGFSILVNKSWALINNMALRRTILDQNVFYHFEMQKTRFERRPRTVPNSGPTTPCFSILRPPASVLPAPSRDHVAIPYRFAASSSCTRSLSFSSLMLSMARRLFS